MSTITLNERQFTSQESLGWIWNYVDDPTPKFRDEAVKMSKSIGEVFGKYGGMGFAGVYSSGLLGRQTPDKIASNPPRKLYIFNMNRFPKLGLGLGVSAIPAEWQKAATKAITKAGFKKGNEFVLKKKEEGKVLQAYFYKKISKDEIACAMIQAPVMYITKANLQIFLYDLKYDDAFRRNIMEATEYSEFQDALERQKDASETPGADGVETSDLDTVFGHRDERLGFEHSITFAADWEADSFFPKAKEKINEMMDLTDTETRRAVMNLSEADTASVLHSLANRLYDNIVKKVDDIDYGDIPGTKGDITKLPNYQQILECNNLIHQILVEYHQDTRPVENILTAVRHIEERKEMFEKAYKYRSELPTLMYENVVLAIIGATSYMIATSIEFIKTPNSDGFNVTFNKMSHVKTRDYMLYGSLEKFNAMVEKGDFDKAMNYILQNRIKKVTEAAATGVFGVSAVIIGVTLVLSIIPILRELVFFFFYMRTKIADFFDVQADLLQMNAFNLQNGEGDSSIDERETVIAKQLKIVDKFRKISNFFAIKGKEAEVKATKEITSENVKQKISDMTDSLPDSSASALF